MEKVFKVGFLLEVVENEPSATRRGPLKELGQVRAASTRWM